MTPITPNEIPVNGNVYFWITPTPALENFMGDTYFSLDIKKYPDMVQEKSINVFPMVITYMSGNESARYGGKLSIDRLLHQ